MSEPWDPSGADPVDVERPNLLAVFSVLCGGVAFISACGCYLAAFTLPVFGVLGLITGVLARRQAAETGHGADYAWWGIVLGVFNTSVGVAGGIFFGLATLQ